ncbi:DUF4402 domain-containing protein [Novosphingobium sp.]|uniref:DUF4402 domain-containing protein n=1 Tax=Novosphingobium sp. TaxID=1874826 RepID=UPI0026323A1E|nr:DUF4402 domain-containing protein [Novosphingobium sp.]
MLRGAKKLAGLAGVAICVIHAKSGGTDRLFWPNKLCLIPMPEWLGWNSHGLAQLPCPVGFGKGTMDAEAWHMSGVKVGDGTIVRLCRTLLVQRSKVARPIYAIGALCALLAGAPHIEAKVPQVLVRADQPLRFGTLLVPLSGSRTVSPQGQITDIGLFEIRNDPVGPAQFTVTYDRGNESRRSIDIEIQIFLSGSQRIRVGGVEGQVSQLTSDISGSGGLMTEGSVRLTIRNCRERQCSVSFRVGARIDLTRSAGGASLVLPLSATATVLSAR